MNAHPVALADLGPCIEAHRVHKASGYGMVYVGGKDQRAHRVVYAAAHGAIPPGVLIRHRCDNRACIRIDHLEQGGHLENAGDRVARGRSAIGLANGRAKWSDDQIGEMRARRAKGETLASIAQDYGAHPATLSRITRGLRRGACA